MEVSKRKVEVLLRKTSNIKLSLASPFLEGCDAGLKLLLLLPLPLGPVPQLEELEALLGLVSSVRPLTRRSWAVFRKDSRHSWSTLTYNDSKF